AQGTVSIYYQADGSRAATASPNTKTDAAMRSQGLRPDPDVGDQSFIEVLQGQLGLPGPIRLVIVVSEPYTTRLATLDSVRGTLLLAGLIALVVSLVIGGLAARRMTIPLARLRRAASRL